MQSLNKLIKKHTNNILSWKECMYCNHMCSNEKSTIDCKNNVVCNDCVESHYRSIQ